jgi:hypothetical protein
MANSDGSLHVPEERLIFSGLDSVRRLDVGGCCGFVAVFATALLSRNYDTETDGHQILLRN